MLYEKHGYERNRHKDSRVIEERTHTSEQIHDGARQNGRYDLRRHTRGIIVTRKFTDVTAACEFDYHREGIDVYRRPAYTRKSKQYVEEYNRRVGVYERRPEERRREQADAY